MVSDVISQVTTATNENMDQLVRQTGGASVLATVIQANASDTPKLIECLNRILQVPGGSQALWSVMEQKSEELARTNLEMAQELMRQLLDDMKTEGRATIPGTFVRVKAVTQAMNEALKLQLSAAQSDSRQQMIAMKTLDYCVSIMSVMELLPEGATALSQFNGIEGLTQLLAANQGDPEHADRIVSIMRRAVATGSQEFMAECSKPTGMRALVGVVRSQKQNGALVEKVLETVQSVV
jgi:hypothetical protein